MEFLNKWLKLNNMDGLVPTLEMEDLYPEDGPLLKDHFLGVDGLSGDQPLCVVFVDPNTQNTNGELHGQSLLNPTNGFYDEYTAPSWLENNVDLNDLDSMTNTYSSPASVSTIPFIDPPVSQNFIIPDTTYGYEKIAYAPVSGVKPVMQTQPQMKSRAYETSEMEHDYYYDASPESMAESLSSWNSSAEEEYPTKEAILEEIHREAAEIERFSVSPPASKVSRKSKPIKKTKSRSVSIPKSYVERKKELNRQAATKYREKKRAEKEGLHHEREHLETRNTELKAEVAAMSSEIEYLKKLIKDIEARTKH